MSYWWSDNTPVDSTGKRRTPYASLYKNIRYNLVFQETITIGQHDLANLPGIAYRYYQDQSIFHIILAYNGLSDPLTDIYPGIPLNLFTKASLDAFLASQKTPLTSTRTQTISI